MLRVWSQATRPKIYCNCIACTKALPGIASRRSTSGVTGKALKLVDAFAWLLAPGLATVSILDADKKDQRRKAWDLKIAQVEEETARLRAQEGCILDSLNHGPRCFKNRLSQVRHYSTLSPAQRRDDGDEGEIQHPIAKLAENLETVPEADICLENDVPEVFQPHPPKLAEPAEALVENDVLIEDDPNEGTHAHIRLERLVAAKFVIRTLLHIHIPLPPAWGDIFPRHTLQSFHHPGEVDALMNNLLHIRRRLHKWNVAENDLQLPENYPSPRQSQATIDTQIRHVCQDFQNGVLSAPTLVSQIGEIIIMARDSPSIEGYLDLIEVFSRAQLRELVSLTIASIFEARLSLPSVHAICTILLHIGKNSNLAEFETFLNRTIAPEKAHVFAQSWTLERINGFQIPCPTMHDPNLFQILIYTALRCNQYHRAIAWTIFLDSRVEISPALTILKSVSYIYFHFLSFYASQRDWWRGRVWLERALELGLILGRANIRHLQRVVWAILDLCAACAQQETYSIILAQAIRARIEAPPTDKNVYLGKRLTVIRMEWYRLLHSSASDPVGDRFVTEKTTVFCEGVRHALGPTFFSKPLSFDDLWEHLKGEKNGFFPHLHNDVEPGLQQLCESQKAEIARLKAELGRVNPPRREYDDDMIEHNHPTSMLEALAPDKFEPSRRSTPRGGHELVNASEILAKSINGFSSNLVVEADDRNASVSYRPTITDSPNVAINGSLNVDLRTPAESPGHRVLSEALRWTPPNPQSSQSGVEDVGLDDDDDDDETFPQHIFHADDSSPIHDQMVPYQPTPGLGSGTDFSRMLPNSTTETWNPLGQAPAPTKPISERDPTSSEKAGCDVGRGDVRNHRVRVLRLGEKAPYGRPRRLTVETVQPTQVELSSKVPPCSDSAPHISSIREASGTGEEAVIGKPPVREKGLGTTAPGHHPPIVLESKPKSSSHVPHS